ncbi:enoyl-CoA hydratase-related protein [Oceanisphaera arctica]|uniref:Enoyl-CoA hydratase n=1 Tax=Oceanisphaera arctica TaxID=641510 RepID=A0A2P5TJM3_9GAMM|nr:enoyl-CoA hydratase-related protein [Oceanisphaera arctica]PPL15178.1 enoyl-CoA hydratase [Oceanisphaera arctica]GHA04018.1 gamma-carboxygeranoyl-CoA hydratase [Oceanisphaera arctica]
MKEPVQLEERSPGVWELTLNRPERHNAFDERLIAAMSERLEQAAHQSGLRVLVLRGTGKHFSAGADLNWMQRAATLDETQNLADARQLAQLLRQLDNFPSPTLALVQGAAYGGALGLVACCDLVVAAANARFALSEVRLGLISATISPYVLRALGPRQARRYMLTAEVMEASIAEQLGLVHLQAAPEQSLDEAAAPLIRAIRRNGPRALTAAKLLVRDFAGQVIDEDLIEDSAHRLAELRVGAEAREGLDAFLNKRPPTWEDEDV